MELEAVRLVSVESRVPADSAIPPLMSSIGTVAYGQLNSQRQIQRCGGSHNCSLHFSLALNLDKISFNLNFRHLPPSSEKRHKTLCTLSRPEALTPEPAHYNPFRGEKCSLATDSAGCLKSAKQPNWANTAMRWSHKSSPNF